MAIWIRTGVIRHSRPMSKVKPQPARTPAGGENSLAPEACDALAFREYTQRVWSRVAGRPISVAEAEQIIEDFGRFLRALAGEDGGIA
jgi:hypothetical protein